MNKKQNKKEDPLDHYINNNMTVEAPEGFTSRVMSLVQLENVHLRHRIRYEDRRIPIYSAIFIIALTGLAFITGGKNESLKIPVPELIKGIKLTFPDFNTLFSIHLPSTLTYVFAGLLILLLFDAVLKQVFHREN